MVVGSPQSETRGAAQLARELGALVVSPDYRLAPEHPYPAALDDCMSTLYWMRDNADELGIDPDRIAVTGSSAGGGLTAAVAQRAHDEGIRLRAQAMVYPMLDDRTVLRDDHGGRGRFLWTPASNRFGWTAYLGRPPRMSDAPEYAAPARREDLSGLAPAWIGVGDLDLFYDESVDYADRLRAAGVDMRAGDRAGDVPRRRRPGRQSTCDAGVSPGPDGPPAQPPVRPSVHPGMFSGQKGNGQRGMEQQEVACARTARRGEGLPVRPRRRAHRHRECAPRAWKAMFDEYPAGERTAPATLSCRSTRTPTTSTTSTARPREDGVRSFLAQPRHRRCPRATRRPDDAPRRSTGWATGRTPRSSSSLHTRRRRGVRGLAALPGGRRRRGLAAPWSRRAPTPARSSRSPGSTSTSQQRVDGVTLREEHLRGQAGTRLVPARGPAARRRAARRPRCSRTRCPAWRPAAPGTSGSSSASTASARRTRCGARRRRRRHRPRANCWSASDRPATPSRSSRGRSAKRRLDLDLLAQSESLFALSNGHIGLRGNLDEGEPYGLPGTYLNSFYETRPLPYAEAGFGYPEDGQTIVNVTNGKIIRLLVDDEPFDVRYGELLRARTDSRPARRHADPRRGAGAHRRASRSRSYRPGWCRWRSAAWPPSSTWSRRRRIRPCHCAIRAGRQRGPARDRPTTLGCPRC